DVEQLLDIADRTLGQDHPMGEGRIARARAHLEQQVDGEMPTSDGATPPPELRGGAVGAVLGPGSNVGRYTIERLLGEGGMGAVYAATQQRPKRTVALKLIRPGYATAKMLRRFEVESELLGRLKHPGIAQVYDAGVAQTPHGEQPFFAMELVEGVELTKYAEREQLGTRSRLELIAKIADAVEHAHQKGVIHRDLKPGNILVDASGQPKVLDFGVARSTDLDIQTTTMQTDVGALIGTVSYMSPEQASGDPTALDTRSDVYALSVVAYQLLAGRLPYDLGHKMIHEVVRIIREDDPTTLSSVNRTLRGDVETIISKGLEKEPGRRYQSASELADDIRRYLRDQPIAARAPSTMYQLGKFARRNKTLVGGTAAVFVVLLVGTIVSTTFAIRAEDARVEMATALDERDRSLALENEVNEELYVANSFLLSFFGYLSPKDIGLAFMDHQEQQLRTKMRGAGASEAEIEAATQLLGRFVDEGWATEVGRAVLKEEFADRAMMGAEMDLASYPRVQANVLRSIAHLYGQLSSPDEGVAARRLAIEAMVLSGEAEETINGQRGPLAMALVMAGRYEEALQEIDAMGGAEAALDTRHAYGHALARAVGLYLYEQRRNAEAEPYLRAAFDALALEFGETYGNTMQMMGMLANVVRKQGRLEEAEVLFRDLLRLQEETYGEGHRTTIVPRANLSMLLVQMGSPEEGEAMIRGVIEDGSTEWGARSWAVGNMHGKLAETLAAQGRYAEAQRELDVAYALHVEQLGTAHHRTLEIVELCARIHDEWHAVAPGDGHDVTAATWRALLQQE
ncbi:MAG: serine/threonine-protein kinase, partial [Planctomycetota bacterium]